MLQAPNVYITQLLSTDNGTRGLELQITNDIKVFGNSSQQCLNVFTAIQCFYFSQPCLDNGTPYLLCNNFCTELLAGPCDAAFEEITSCSGEGLGPEGSVFSPNNTNCYRYHRALVGAPANPQEYQFLTSTTSATALPAFTMLLPLL